MESKLRAIVLLITICLTSAQAVAAPDQVETSLSRAEDFYARGNFSAAETEIAGLRKVESTLSDLAKARFYLLQARLEFVFNEGNNAQPILEKLHTVQPDAELDPIKDPPLALKIWAQIKSRESAKKNSETVVAPATRNSDNPQQRVTTSPAPPVSKTPSWWQYGMYAAPIAFAVLAPADNTRFAALGFLAGALTFTVWNSSNNTQTVQHAGQVGLSINPDQNNLAGSFTYSF